MKRFFYTLGMSIFLSAFVSSQVAAAVSVGTGLAIFAAAALASAAACAAYLLKGLRSEALLAFTVFIGVCSACGLWYFSHQDYISYSNRFAGSEQTLEMRLISDDGLSSGGYHTYTVREEGAKYTFKLYSSDQIKCGPYDYVTLSVKFYDDADTWLEGSGIAASGFITDIHESRSGAPYPIMYHINSLRTYISSAADSAMGEYSALGKALVLADKSDMTSFQKDVISGAGVSHIMAVSGFHVSILCALIMFLTSFIRSRRLSIILTVALLTAFMALCGFVPSVVRSVLMISICYAGRFIGRPTDGRNNLGFAVTAMLAVNPLLIYSASFLLLAAGTFAIVALYPDVRLSASTFIFRHMRAEPTKAVRFITDLVLIGIVCAICTLPFTYVLFGEISITSVISNILCLPVMQVTLVLCFLSIGISCIPGLNALGALIGGAAGTGLDIFMSFSETLTRLSRPTDSAVAAISIAAGLLCLLALNLKKDKSLPRSLLAPMLITLALAASGTLVSEAYAHTLSSDGTTRLCFVDVGQGLCSVLIDGDSAIVMDCGGSLSPGENAADYLQSMGVRRIECIIISHLDEDHTEGLEALCARYRTDEIILPYISNDTNMLDSILAAAASGGATVITAEKDMTADTDHLQIDILASHLDIYEDDNDNSLVCVVQRGKFKALFCGDISQSAEKELVELYPEKLKDCTVLSVPHHGSAYSSGEEFLEETSPVISVISVGDNSYGHPSPEVVQRLENFGIVFRTDVSGGVEIRTDGRTAEVYELK